MSNRIISLNISDAYISAIGGSIGATGSGNATTLRMTFDEHWDGTTKTVYFIDANGANSISVILGLNMLVEGTTATYDVPVPAEPLAVPGNAKMTVKGVILNGTTVEKAITTGANVFIVLDSSIPGSSSNAGTITASDKDQLQAEIDALEPLFITKSSEASASATAAASSASAAATSATAASTSATNAATSASSVSNSAAAATTKAGEASASATAASDSATSAASSAARAESAKNSAETAQSAAESSATDAASSAASALTSAGNAAASETNAGNSASAATAAASAAQTAKTAAETASENAQSFKTEAAQSASEAAASAAQAAAIVGGDFATHEDVGTAKDEAISTAATALAAHTGNTSNPHAVTKAQVGLGSVDNTADADKPVSGPQQAALDLKVDRTNVLEKDNTTAFTPTGNYHPATKGYVDQTVGAVILPRIVVTAPTGSAVTCHRGSTILTATENSGTWTFNVPDYGTWTITATLGAKSAEDTVVVSVVQLYEVALAYIDDVFANNTWKLIRAAVDQGKVPMSWNAGDFKTITLNGTVGTVTLNNFQCSLQIVAKPGFNSAREGSNILHLRFASADGTKGLAFCDSGYGTNTSNASKFNMNPTNVNTGGFWASTMNTGILGNTGTPAAPTANSLMSCLPQEVRDVMVQCTKYNDNTGGGADTASFVTAKQYWIALPAEFEVFGTRTYANSAEQNYQQQYPFFAAGNSKIHYRHDALATAVIAWERSVTATNTATFGLVTTTGTATYGNACDSYVVPPLLFI